VALSQRTKTSLTSTGTAYSRNIKGFTWSPPPRARMPLTQPCGLVRACARWRKIVETVGSQLTEHFAVARIRVRDLWHFHARLIRKVLAHTIGVFLNLQLGRQPLDLDGILMV